MTLDTPGQGNVLHAQIFDRFSLACHKVFLVPEVDYGADADVGEVLQAAFLGLSAPVKVFIDLRKFGDDLMDGFHIVTGYGRICEEDPSRAG